MMKRIVFVLLTATLLGACQKADDNGDLGGNWKLLQILEFDSDSVMNVRKKGYSWAIQLDLLAINKKGEFNHPGKGRFQHIGDSLFVQMINIPHNATEFGLYNPKDERFKVELLNNRKMTLRSKYALLQFCKF